MMAESRTKKTLLNARINLLCYALNLILSFFTRKIFLDYLGAEFMGLTSTSASILGFLNLAELGVGLAIGYTLYTPLQKQDKASINEIISLLGYLYRWIGIIIFSAGVILSVFLPFIFPDTEFSLGVIYCCFYTYLVSSLIGYFVNYKANLLSADQKNYIVTGYFQITSTIQIIIQMLFAIWICNFYIYFAIQFTFGIINALILSIKIKKTYPWLSSNVKEGRKLFKKYGEISRNVKLIFIHKITGFIQSQTTPLFIYGFLSLSSVTLFANYSLITQKLLGFLGVFLNSSSAGIGNLIAEGDKNKIYKVYQELQAFRLYTAAVFSACVYYLANDFIELWLGNEYLLSEIIVIMVSVQLFMTIYRGCSDQFLYGFGLFHDIWAPGAEAVIFFICAFFGGMLWGLEGVLLGSIISILTIVHIWKPIFLYSKGFHRPITDYLKITIPGILGACVLLKFSAYTTHMLIDNLNSLRGWLKWVANGSIFFCVMSISFAVFMLVTSHGARYFVHRFSKRIGKL